MQCTTILYAAETLALFLPLCIIAPLFSEVLKRVSEYGVRAPRSVRCGSELGKFLGTSGGDSLILYRR